jgi:uncharacterized OB-fold protein
MTTHPPLQQGLFEPDTSGTPRLLASRCTACARVFFPVRTYCGKCGASGLQQLQLGGRGRIHSFSVIDRKPKLAVIDAPYVQAEVVLPEGVHVFTVLDQCAPCEVRVDMEVEMYVGEVNAPTGGGKALAFKFRPVTAGGAA